MKQSCRDRSILLRYCSPISTVDLDEDIHLGSLVRVLEVLRFLSFQLRSVLAEMSSRLQFDVILLEQRSSLWNCRQWVVRAGRWLLRRDPVDWDCHEVMLGSIRSTNTREYVLGDIPAMIDHCERSSMIFNGEETWNWRDLRMAYESSSSVFGGSSREKVRSDIFF